MRVSFAVEIKPQPQGSITAFLLPNKDAVESAAKTIRTSPHLSMEQIIPLITAACKKVRATLTAGAKSTFHPIICTTEYCCLTTNPADNNCCKTDADPCPIH